MVDLPGSSHIRGAMNRFSNEDQDPAVVEKVHTRVSEILTSGEDVLYIAVQNKLGLNLAPDCVVLTNKRFIQYKPSITGGVSFEDYIWRDLREAHVKEGIRSASLTLKTTSGGRISCDDLPKAQARRLYTLAQNMEEQVREERRERELEEKRAAAGGVVMQTGVPTQQAPSAPVKEDPMEQLTKLKKMLDADLITQDEFNAKKADILSRM